MSVSQVAPLLVVFTETTDYMGLRIELPFDNERVFFLDWDEALPQGSVFYHCQCCSYGDWNLLSREVSLVSHTSINLLHEIIFKRNKKHVLVFCFSTMCYPQLSHLQPGALPLIHDNVILSSKTFEDSLLSAIFNLRLK